MVEKKLVQQISVVEDAEEFQRKAKLGLVGTDHLNTDEAALVAKLRFKKQALLFLENPNSQNWIALNIAMCALQHLENVRKSRRD